MDATAEHPAAARQATACRRCESPLAANDLRCAICGLPAIAADESSGEETVAKVLRCHGCGAAVAYRAEAQAPRCDFCSEVMELETPEDPVDQAEAFVRFRVTPEQARAALAGWLGSRGFFRPADLRAEARIGELRPLWWAGWMFDADVLMSWAADSDAGSRRSRWAPHAGQARVAMRRVVVPASQGLREDECAALVPHYDVSDVTPEPEQAFHDATVEQFVLQRSSARKLLGRALRGVAAEHAVAQLPGSTHRNLRVEVLPTRLDTRHLAFPAHVLAYRYRDRVYRAIVHGQDPKCVIGAAPWAVGRIVAVVLGALGLVALVVVLVVLLGGRS
jgi:hypothetical protein